MSGAVVVGGRLMVAVAAVGAKADRRVAVSNSPARSGFSQSTVLLAFDSPLLFAGALRRRQNVRPSQTGEGGELQRATGPEPDEEAAGLNRPLSWARRVRPEGNASSRRRLLRRSAVMWVFMYFVEFLGGVSVIG